MSYPYRNSPLGADLSTEFISLCFFGNVTNLENFMKDNAVSPNAFVDLHYYIGDRCRAGNFTGWKLVSVADHLGRKDLCRFLVDQGAKIPGSRALNLSEGGGGAAVCQPPFLPSAASSAMTARGAPDPIQPARPEAVGAAGEVSHLPSFALATSLDGVAATGSTASAVVVNDMEQAAVAATPARPPIVADGERDSDSEDDVINASRQPLLTPEDRELAGNLEIGPENNPSSPRTANKSRGNSCCAIS